MITLGQEIEVDIHGEGLWQPATVVLVNKIHNIGYAETTYSRELFPFAIIGFQHDEKVREKDVDSNKQ